MPGCKTNCFHSGIGGIFFCTKLWYLYLTSLEGFLLFFGIAVYNLCKE